MSTLVLMPSPTETATEHEILVRHLTQLRDGTHPRSEQPPLAAVFEWRAPLLALTVDR